MPACPRKDVVDPDVVAVYHCWNRCVRRARLCGVDDDTGRDYEYRRQWVVDREALLARFYALEIAWHAELSNHIHLIVRSRPDVVQTWSDEEVVRRILTINRLTRNFSDQYETPTDLEIKVVLCDAEKVADYRRRLADVSCFMASLDEYIARRCNYDDEVTGHFWESRFGCRNLEDESAILVCGIYIDLNQIRAGEAATPETSQHTSAYNRIQGLRERLARESQSETATVQSGDRDPATASADGDPQGAMPADGWLCELTLREGLDSNVRDGLSSSSPWRLTDKGILPVTLREYLSLLDWTGRQQAAGKSGSIPGELVSILERLHIQPTFWLDAITHFETLFGRALGRAENLARRAATTGHRWLRGARICSQVFT